MRKIMEPLSKVFISLVFLLVVACSGSGGGNETKASNPSVITPVEVIIDPYSVSGEELLKNLNAKVLAKMGMQIKFEMKEKFHYMEVSICETKNPITYLQIHNGLMKIKNAMEASNHTMSELTSLERSSETIRINKSDEVSINHFYKTIKRMLEDETFMESNLVKGVDKKCFVETNYWAPEFVGHLLTVL
ncbi:MAG: hypothetical protein QE271_04665 [Bacteriovoracaceae bacterium]|nr:hypothetical protein [Bacteriovoracaceae bacterium]